MTVWERKFDPYSQQQYKPSGSLLSTTLTIAPAWSAHQWTGGRFILCLEQTCRGIFQYSVNLFKSNKMAQSPDNAPVFREQVLDLVNVLVCSLVLSVATTLFCVLVKYYSSISFLNRSAEVFLNFDIRYVFKVGILGFLQRNIHKKAASMAFSL